MKTTVRAHTSIIRAIRDQDEEAAARRMGRHVHSYAEDVLAVENREEVEIVS